MRKTALVLALAMLLALAIPMAAYADDVTFTADAATAPEAETTAEPVTTVSPEAEAMAAVGAQTLTEVVVDKLKNGESNTVRVSYNPKIGLTAEIMQALKESEGKIIVLTQLRNTYPLWKLTIQSNFVTADPAHSFKPDFSFEQDPKSAAITVNIGRDKKLLGCKVKVSIPADNGNLLNDAELLADKIALYKLNTETQQYEKTSTKISIDDAGYVTFIIDVGGTYNIKNNM